MKVATRLISVGICWLILACVTPSTRAQDILANEPEASRALDFGEYEYDRGVFLRIKDGVVNQTMALAEGISSGLDSAEATVANIANFGALGRSENSTVGIAGTLNLQMFGGVLQNRGGARGYMRRQRLAFRFGPFLLDQIQGGAGAMYSEYQGDAIFGPIGVQNSEATDPNLAALTWLTGRFGMSLTDRFALVVNPSVYYLPLKNELGWSVLGPAMGLRAMMAPRAIAHVGYRTRLSENLNLLLMDTFGGYQRQSALMQNLPYMINFYGDRRAVDYAGRYRFGGRGGESLDWNASDRITAGNHLLSSRRMIYLNQFNARLVGRHGANIESSTHYNNLSFWNHQLKGARTWQDWGTFWLQEHPYFTPWARYEGATRDNFRSYYQYVMTGMNRALTQDLFFSAGGGWHWITNRNHETSDTWIGQASVNHRLGPYTNHGAEIGKSIMGRFTTRYIAKYAQYFLSQKIGPRSHLVFYAQKSEADLYSVMGPSLVARKGSSVGLAMVSQPTRRLMMMANASMDRYEFQRFRNAKWQSWTYQLVMNYQMSQTLMANLFYQYQDMGYMNEGSNDFYEHLLYLGLNKQF